MSKNLLAAAVSAAVLFASPFSAAQADEGVVTVYMPSPTGLNAKYVAQFEKQTGIKVKLFEGTTGKISRPSGGRKKQSRCRRRRARLLV